MNFAGYLTSNSMAIYDLIILVTVPNSIQYFLRRKHNLYAGPRYFLGSAETVSARSNFCVQL